MEGDPGLAQTNLGAQEGEKTLELGCKDFKGSGLGLACSPSEAMFVFVIFFSGSDSEQEGGHLQGLLQVWVQGQHQAQAR